MDVKEGDEEEELEDVLCIVSFYALNTTRV